MITSVKWLSRFLSFDGSYYEMQHGRLWSKYTGHRGRTLVEFKEEKTAFIGVLGKWEMKGNILTFHQEDPLTGEKYSYKVTIKDNTITINKVAFLKK